MARKRVIVDAGYLDVIKRRSTLLGTLFHGDLNGSPAFTATPEDFKEVARLDRALEKIPDFKEVRYGELKPSKASKKRAP